MALLVILCIIMAVLDITEFISWSKAKEKVFVGNWINIAAHCNRYLVSSIHLSYSTRAFRVPWILTDIIPLLSIFDVSASLSPEGLSR